MKLEPKSGKLTADNRSVIDSWLKTFGKDQSFAGLLCLVADVLDAAASGRDCYCVIGTNRDKSALLVSVTEDKAKGYANGFTIRELSEACESLL